VFTGGSGLSYALLSPIAITEAVFKLVVGVVGGNYQRAIFRTGSPVALWSD